MGREERGEGWRMEERGVVWRVGLCGRVQDEGVGGGGRGERGVK